MAILLSAILALLPLTLAPGLLFYYDITPKIVVLLAGTAIGLILARREMQARSPELRVFGMLLTAQGASLAVSTAFSSDVALSLGGSTWRRFGLITQLAMLLFAWFAAQYAAGDAGRVRQLIRVIAVAGIPAAVYGIAQYFGWDPFIDRSLYHIGEAPLTIVRPPGTLGYVSYYATYLLSVIFAGAALILTEQSRWWKIAGAASGVLGTLAVTLTGTRAALLGLAAGLLFLAVWLGPRVRTIILAAVAAVVLGMAGFYLSPAGQMLRSRTRWFFEDPLGGGRLLLWRDSLRMCAVRWPVGFGPETFSIHFPRYQSPELARAYPAFFQESPHNIFIDALAGQGVPGLAILIGLTALGFYSMWKVRHRAEAAALGAALLGAVDQPRIYKFYAADGSVFLCDDSAGGGSGVRAGAFSGRQGWDDPDTSALPSCRCSSSHLPLRWRGPTPDSRASTGSFARINQAKRRPCTQRSGNGSLREYARTCGIRKLWLGRLKEVRIVRSRWLRHDRR